MKTFYTYILSNENTTAITTGVTHDLLRRCFEYKNDLVEGLARKHKVDKLLYFESFGSLEQAVQRASWIRGLPREKKAMLIRDFNPTWSDLYVNARIDTPRSQTLFSTVAA